MTIRYAPLLVLLVVPGLARAQGSSSELDVFGYFQSVFDHSSDETTIMRLPAVTGSRNTFILQQANIFFRKQFDPHFTAFVSLEFTNTYASTRKWGTFRIEEGWVRYEPYESFSVKAGLLVPVFNNLNEIKNRMPLLPYITRPFIYEAAAEGVGSLDDFTPASAFLQIQGTVHCQDVLADYAVYVGNGDPTFTNSGEEGVQYSIGGTDTTTFKLIGARVGMRWGKVKAGFSVTSDKANRKAIGIGPVHRLRFGADLSCQIGPVSLESELISTKEYMDDRQTFIYNTVARMDPRLGKEPINFFAYGVLSYDISESFYAYGGLEYLDSHRNSLTRGYMAGGGYRPIDEVVVKLQYLHIGNDFQGLSTFLSDRVQAGVSVMF
jgi:hypothetical protein